MISEQSPARIVDNAANYEPGKYRKFLRSLLESYLPAVHDRLLLSEWKKSFNQDWGNPIYFSRPPSRLSVTGIGRRSYCASKIDCHHVSSDTEISVGNYTSIGQNLKFIASSGHSMNSLTTFPFRSSKGKNVARITIGSDVWIGDDVTIIGAVKIGNGCVIGTGSIVTKDLMDFGIYAGVPAKLVRFRYTPEVIHILTNTSWWNLDDKIVDSLEKYLTSENILEAIERIELAVANHGGIEPQNLV